MTSAWMLLVLCVLAGGVFLVHPRLGGRRGATLVGFLLLSLGMTSPIALHPTELMLRVASGSDAFIGVWNLWWTRTALARGMNPLEGSWIFHPNGTTLALHTSTLTYGVLSLPLQWLLRAFHVASPDDLFVSFNAIVIASFALTAYFTYRLALGESGDRGAALLGAIAFAFANFRIENVVRLHVLASEFFVLATWAWVALLRRPSPSRLGAFAAAAVLLAYVSLEYTAYAALMLSLLVIAELRGRPWRDAGMNARRLPATLAVLAVAAVALLPLVVPVGARLREGAIGFDPSEARFYSADLFDPLLPNPRHPLWQVLPASWRAMRRDAPAVMPSLLPAGAPQGIPDFGLAVGWLALVLFVLGVSALLRARRQRIWPLGALVFWLLSLGPELHVHGRILPLPLPFALLARVPLLGASRTPKWYMMPAELCIAMTIATGWAVRRRSRDRGAGRGESGSPSRLEVMLGSLLLIEALAAPLPLSEVRIPAAYREIQSPPGSSALIHLPALASREELLFQTVHQQRTVQDLSRAIPLRSHRGPDPFATAEWNVLTQRLSVPGMLSSPGASGLNARLHAFLARYQIRWVVLTRSAAIPAAHDPRLLPGSDLDDAGYAAYRENLRRLDPLHEVEVGPDTLFEFAVAPIGGDEAAAARQGAREAR
ncbi:MAG TPA: hypothetical protein VEI94_11515 [Candidatus Bathyarchaeia archaeon]|nr:hypothetical protein [Candidatus Bathyarchaeia archaeon]